MHRPHHDHTFLGSDRHLARLVAKPLARFLAIEAAGGILLLGAAIVALVWASSPWRDSYVALFGAAVDLHAGPLVLHGTVQHWINDGLMAVFFFVAGLEIKRELVHGELRDPRAAALPIVGAIGGMAAPAIIFLSLNAGTDASHGWGIPVATDIAFAVGVVSLLGRRVPPGLRLFLLALAIVDDIGGIIVIAAFYTRGLSPLWLLAAAAGLGVCALLRRWQVWYLPVYGVVGVGVWLAMYLSGVHATIAGVALALLVPIRPLRDRLDAGIVVDALEGRRDLSASDARAASFLIRETVPVGDRLTDALHPWTSYVVLPLFALANAGIPLGGDALAAAASSRVTIGVVLGLVVGKTIGIVALAKLATRLRLASLPEGATTLHLVATAIAAGIGFTVAVFVAGLAFEEQAAFGDQAKVGIIVASLVAASLSALTFVIADRRARRADPSSHEPSARPAPEPVPA